MVPLTRLTTRNSIRISDFVSYDRLEKVLNDTKVGGATLTSMLGTSAWYAPGAAVSALVHSIACDKREVFHARLCLTGNLV